MSFHELTSDYPWLTKRIQRMLRMSDAVNAEFPRRHALAWTLALFVPNVGAGGANGIPAMIGMVAMVGIFAAIAIPNFVRFQQRTKCVQVGALRSDLQQRATAYIEKHHALPADLADLGLESAVPSEHVLSIEIANEGFLFQLAPSLHDSAGESFALVPYRDDAGELRWSCGESMRPPFQELICDDRATASDGAGTPDPGLSPEQPRTQTDAESENEWSDPLLGDWLPMSDEAALQRLRFGAGNSVILTLEDGEKLLGTYAQMDSSIALHYATDGAEVVRTFELSRANGRLLLRPEEGGPFYVRNP